MDYQTFRQATTMRQTNKQKRLIKINFQIIKTQTPLYERSKPTTGTKLQSTSTTTGLSFSFFNDQQRASVDRSFSKTKT